jgi:hypothetical protein
MKLSGAVAGLFASIGIALVMTAALAPGRQTPAVLESGLKGVAGLESAALGN